MLSYQANESVVNSDNRLKCRWPNGRNHDQTRDVFVLYGSWRVLNANTCQSGRQLNKKHGEFIELLPGSNFVIIT